MEIRLKLDAYNPAEFYAALGLLELISRQDGSVSHTSTAKALQVPIARLYCVQTKTLCCPMFVQLR